MTILLAFIDRLSFGLALSMGLTSARQVPSGYFRVHLYVLLGMNACAALAAWQVGDRHALWLTGLAGLASYLGSAMWLYELAGPGKLLLGLVSVLSIVGAWLVPGRPASSELLARGLWLCDPVSSGLITGSTMAAMLLGHWYLNTPSMQLEPLKRLIKLIVLAVLLRAVVCGLGLALSLGGGYGIATDQAWFLVLRWTAGIVGTLGAAILAWQTLKIPNTQSATGILYVAVLTALLGELTSQLLSAETAYPL